jgi:hypothetical protein
MLPTLDQKVAEFQNSKSTSQKRYLIPKRKKFVVSRRTDQEIAGLLSKQRERGIFEGLLISVVSRVEAHLQECVRVAINRYPEKITILADDKFGIPLDMVLEADDKLMIMEEYVAAKCEGFLYLPPKKYIEKIEKILSISINKNVAADYLELKACRDLIIHNSGVINRAYKSKAGNKARGEIDARVEVDKEYFNHMIEVAKAFAGSIMDGVENKFG